MVGSFVAFEAFAEDLTGEEARKKYQRTVKAVTPETDLILTPCSGLVIKESEKIMRMVATGGLEPPTPAL